MPMDKIVAPELDIPSDSELNTLKELWNTGKLQTISDHLIEFIHRHSGEISDYMRNSPSPENWVEAVKHLVRVRGSIHLPSDMADQIREINNELWYRGEKGDLNRAKIQEEWAVLYASRWRSWRVKEIIYVIDRRIADVSATFSV